MPLLNGNTPHILHENIKELVRTGRPQAQAVAIALDHARQSGQHTAMAEVHHTLAQQALTTSHADDPEGLGTGGGSATPTRRKASKKKP